MVTEPTKLELPPPAESPLEVQLSKLDMQAGQIVLVSVPNTYSQFQMAQIQRDLIKLVPDGCAVLVAYNEIAFHILGQDDDPPDEIPTPTPRLGFFK